MNEICEYRVVFDKIALGCVHLETAVAMAKKLIKKDEPLEARVQKYDFEYNDYCTMYVFGPQHAE